MATRGWQHVQAIVSPAKPPRKAARMPQERRSKYRAIRTEVDGITFDSKAEARRYAELKALAAVGDITHLILQPRYGIYAHPIGGDMVKVADYYGDFQYYTKDGELVLEDVKGMRTPMYRLKRKFVEAHYGIVIREIR